jgi:hypothetical protein
MAYYILQSGSTLQRISTSGAVTALTLPTNVTVASNLRGRFDVLGDLCVVVNSPSENLSVDRYNNVNLLTPKAPSTPCVLTAVAGGGLTGTFKVKYTFVIKDAYGNLISESGFSPESTASPALASKFLLASNVAVSTQYGITHRRMYRTTTGPGSTYFRWIDLAGNTLTTIQDDLSDVGLQNIAADTDLGTPPPLSVVKQWQNRLWGRAINDPDNLLYSGNGRIYAWNASQSIPIPPPHIDVYGITTLISRRDELGVAKRSAFHVVRGTDETNFTRYTVAEQIGVWAPDSVSVIRDTGYFLGNPFGVYSWGGEGIKNISDEKVKAWFATDTYFNRANFLNAVGAFDPVLNAYILLLSSPGQTTLDRWIQLNLTDMTWWGPHKTAEFTPTYVASMLDANDVGFLAFGSSGGKLYAPQATKTDGASSAIDFDVAPGYLTGQTPTIVKLWERPSIATQVEATGTLQITAGTGGPDETERAILSHDLTTGNQTLPRLGVGVFLKLRFRQNTAGQNVIIYGIELPFHELGNRSK